MSAADDIGGNTPVTVRRSSDVGLDAHDKKLLQTLEQWGWFVMKVGASDSQPAFAYSLGMYENLLHPEIVVLGLDLDIMHHLINDAAANIRKGHRYEAGRRYGDLLQGHDCEFRRVDPTHYRGVLNYALWYYKSSNFPTLQLVWPDPQRRFPWEEGFDERFRKSQPVLG